MTTLRGLHSQILDHYRLVVYQRHIRCGLSSELIPETCSTEDCGPVGKPGGAHVSSQNV